MATTIDLIKVPVVAYVPYGDTPAGVMTVKIYESSSVTPPSAVIGDLVGTVNVNIADIPVTTVISTDWSKHNIGESQWTRFELGTPITIDPDANDYCISLSFSGMVSVGPTSCSLFIGGLLNDSFSYYFYDFDNAESGAPGWVIFWDGKRYFGLKAYTTGDIEIGSIPIDNEYTEVVVANRILEEDYYDSDELGYTLSVASAPLAAITPFPATAATGVSTSVTAFSWVDGGGYGIDYFEVYFDYGTGTLPTEPTATVYTSDFLCGLCLQPEFDYKWRVDSVNQYGTTTGTEWTFSTGTTPFYVPVLTQPTVWFSATGDYENFDPGTNDADSFSISIQSTNEIRWVSALESLLVGTAGDEWKIGTNKLETPVSPTNWSSKQQTTIGSAKIQPVKFNGVILYVDYVGRKVMEMTFGDLEKYTSTDMNSLAEHITESGIINIAHQRNPESTLWCVLADGSLIALVYDREQNVVAWSDHPIDGTVQSVSVIPGDNEDQVWISVLRTIDSSEVVYVERLETRIQSDIEDSFFVDSGKVVSGTSATITGLDHLEGETVAALVDGVYDGTYTVSSAQITTTTTPTEKTVVGVPYTAVLQPMRIVQSTQAGSSMGAITRIHNLKVSFLNSAGVQYGDSTSDLYNFNFSDERLEDAGYKTGLFSGDVPVNMTGGFSMENPIIISSSQPLPMTVRAIIASFEQTGR
jgi:hypothetical protein